MAAAINTEKTENKCHHRIKRLRVFAGPNGSGKTTLYEYLVSINAFNSYYHINADLIARDLPVSVNLKNFIFDFSEDELKSFLDASPFQSLVNFKLSSLVYVKDKTIFLTNPDFDDLSYLAASLAEFIRQKTLSSGSSFSFETVFSHSSKLDIIKQAKERGYKTYLYIIFTESPQINVMRIENRVKCGGHDVPPGKIYERYNKTLECLYEASILADEVFFFDNSAWRGLAPFNYFAQKKNNLIFINNGERPPNWFQNYFLKEKGKEKQC